MPQSLNRFAYVNGNPLKYVDPTGNEPLKNGVARTGGLEYDRKVATRGADPDAGWWTNFFDRLGGELTYNWHDTFSVGHYGRVDRLGGQLARGEITNRQFELMRESSFYTAVALGAVELGAIALSALLVPAGIIAGAAYGAVEGVSLVFASDAIRMNGGFQDDWSSPYVYATAGLLGSGGGALGGAARNARLGAVPLRQAGKALPSVLREEVGALASSARQLTREAGAFGRAARETLVGQPGAVRMQSGIDPSPMFDYFRGLSTRQKSNSARFIADANGGIQDLNTGRGNLNSIGRQGPIYGEPGVPPARGYHHETRAPRPVRSEDAVNEWERFLGPGPHTNRHPRTGLPDPDRIVSADGTRSIRYGTHEMKKPHRHHYHEETWTYDPDQHVMNVDNRMISVPLPRP